MANEGVAETELQRAKRLIRARLAFNYMNGATQLAQQLSSFQAFGSWRLFETFESRIEAVTADQIQSVVRKYFRPENRTVVQYIPTPVAQLALVDPAKLEVERTLPAASEVRVDPRPTPASSRKADSKPQRFRLSNGITLIVRQVTGSSAVAFHGMALPGAGQVPHLRATAAMVADMLPRGTQKRTQQQIADQLDGLGAQISFQLADQSLEFPGAAFKEDLPVVLGLLAEQLREPTFDQAEFEKARQQFLSGLRQERASPADAAYRLVRNSMLPADHPFTRTDWDTLERRVREMGVADLRTFHERYYRPDNLTLAVVGDLNPNQVREMVEVAFSGWKVQGPKPTVRTVQAPQPAARTLIYGTSERSEVQVDIGIPTPLVHSHPDYHAARLLSQILGGAPLWSSRLGAEVRDKKGFAYGVWSYLVGETYPGYIEFTFGTAPQNADKAIDAATAVLERFVREGPTNEEVERAKNFLIGNFAVYNQTNQHIAESLAVAEFLQGGMEYLERRSSMLRGVTRGQIQEAARKYLRIQDATVAIAGTYSGTRQTTSK